MGQVLTDWVSTPLDGKYCICPDEYDRYESRLEPKYMSYNAFPSYNFWDCGHFATPITPGTYMIDISYFGWFRADTDRSIHYSFIGKTDTSAFVLDDGYTIYEDELRDQDVQYGNTVYFTESHWYRPTFTVKETCTVFIRAWTYKDGFFYYNGGGYSTAEAVANWIQRIS